MLFELTMLGTYFNQQIVNRWNYISTGTPAAVSLSFALMNAFGAIPDAGVYPSGSLFVTLMNSLSNQFHVNTIVARACALYSPADFYERPFPTPYSGGDSGVALSPVSAYGFRTNRVRLDIGRGTKRFVGVTEGQNEAGGVVASGALGALVTIGELMSDTLTYDDEGATLSFAPCIVSKLEYTTPSGKKAYKYYPTLADQLEHIATGILWQPYDTVRGQASRQYGKGQ